jgi:DNA-binding response OmpR family regulator
MMPKILLIDDDDQLRTMLKLVLTSSGYEVSEACNGNEASRIYQQQYPDLVITDLLMPDKEGLELIMELRRNNKDIKIIAMSGGGRGGAVNYLEAAGKLGAQQTLAKPFSRQELLRAVRAVMGEGE